MSPSQIETTSFNGNGKATNDTKLIQEPLKLSGLLDKYESFSVTPVIGTEFTDANVAEWLKADNSDDLIRELAITSKKSPIDSHSTQLMMKQYLNVVSSSFAPRKTSPTNFRWNLLIAWGDSLASQSLQHSMFIPYKTSILTKRNTSTPSRLTKLPTRLKTFGKTDPPILETVGILMLVMNQILQTTQS